MQSSIRLFHYDYIPDVADLDTFHGIEDHGRQCRSAVVGQIENVDPQRGVLGSSSFAYHVVDA
jgi:hypothetical protein